MHCLSTASHPAFLQTLTSPHLSHHQAQWTQAESWCLFSKTRTPSTLTRTPMGASWRRLMKRAPVQRWGVIVATGDERGGESLIFHNLESFNQVSSGWCCHWCHQAGNPASPALPPSVLWSLGSPGSWVGAAPHTFLGLCGLCPQPGTF